MRCLAVLSLVIALCACSEEEAAEPAPIPVPDLARIQPVFPGLSFVRPLYFGFAANDVNRVYVAEQGGLIYSFDRTAPVPSLQVLLDISDRTDARGEEGLLGVAFDPRYETNGFVYVYYTANEGLGDSPTPGVARLERFTADPATATADSTADATLFTSAKPFKNHNGGWIAFGADSKLYFALGDGGSGNDPGNRAQNLGSPFGKILRMNTDGSAPADNPFFGAGGDDRIWAYGLRNPFRNSFDRSNGQLWVADVGQNAFEEINIVTRGGNYGWRAREGTQDNPAVADAAPANAQNPVFEYAHGDTPRCSITGGYVYRGTAITGLVGRYVYADFCSREVWALRMSGSTVLSNVLIGTLPAGAMPTSFGEDASGELYITAFDGKLYKLVPPP